MKSDLMAQGWERRSVRGFTDFIGEFWMRREESGPAFGFLAEPKHVNRAGAVHGGLLATIADNTLGWTVMDAYPTHHAATIQLNLHFVAGARPGDFIEGRGEIVRATRTVIFLRGKFSVRQGIIAIADGIWKVSASGAGTSP
jgi:acyl-coenzyme A thioesterase PaaI-like protein